MQPSLCERNRNFLVQFQRNDKKTFCPACVRGPARKGSAADKKASAAALPVTPSRKPRTCGEKYATSRPAAISRGSPPHMQGKVRRQRMPARARRITPACAGKRGTWSGGGCRPRDHPRTCGEKTSFRWVTSAIIGSPPHVRGKEVLGLVVGAVLGITPAHAGKRPVSGGLRVR